MEGKRSKIDKRTKSIGIFKHGHMTLGALINRWLESDVMAAMLVELSQNNLINFYCIWHQHGPRVFGFSVARN